MNSRHTILLACGALSSVVYVATDLLASRWYPGYSLIDQNYSELLATGAPTRQFLLGVSVVYNLMVAAFAIGIRTGAMPVRTARWTAAMMLAYAALSIVTPAFFQMDMRGTVATPLGSLHPHMTAVMSLFIPLSIGVGGFLGGKAFRIYSFATILVLMAFGGLTAAQAPTLAAGGQTPWMGLTERVNIYATMGWFALLSVLLLRARSGNRSPIEEAEHRR